VRSSWAATSRSACRSNHFTWLGAFFGLDTPASAALTHERFGWTPIERGLLDDLEHGTYF
jgi:hypothetical protein